MGARYFTALYEVPLFPGRSAQGRLRSITMKRTISIALSAFFLSACASYYRVKALNPNEVVMTEHNTVTKAGKDFAGRHKTEMMEIYGRLAPLYSAKGAGFASMRDIPYSVGLFRANEPSREAYFGAVLITGSYFDHKTTTFNQRAATVFAENSRQTLEILTSQNELLKDPMVTGIMLLLAWGNNERPEAAPLFSSAEAVRLLMRADDCQAFLRGGITAQELADRSVVTKYVDRDVSGKVKLNLTDVLR